ncbi:3-oxo-5-alpha-steroid 4-dehydrogenase-domain-containing protein [Cunninghamella echinulata]|nr:3-oxo-5-alpha-steroid 4-dehydrogenase-domain-containing protein [Cunninghamella echinulata]
MENIKKIINNPTTYDLVLYLYSTFPLLFTIAVLLINAPYGRFAYNPGSFNKSISRYAWLTMEIVSPVVFFGTLYFSSTKNNIINLSPSQYLCSALWLIHYFNRSIIYSFRAPSISPMHILTWVCSIIFNIVNGYTNGYWVATHSFSLTAEWSRVSFGLCLWWIGFYFNIYHDSILFDLRKQKKQPGDYSIPYGGLFNYISCPNYFSEALEWIGFLLICWSAPSFYFATSTMANLFPRAYRSHQWYKKKFDNYPSNRKAIIPFLL